MHYLKRKKHEKNTLLFLFFTVCRKEVNTVPAVNSTDAALNIVNTTSKWTGYYRAAGQQDVIVEDINFISNGYARLGNSPYPDYFTSIEFIIPDDKVFDGDSLVLKLRVKNPDNVAAAVYPNDVIVYYKGTTDSARMQFSVLPSNIFLGSSTVSTKSVPFVKVFTKWSQVAIEVNKKVFTGGAADNIPNLALGHDPFGRFKSIVITFKGSGSIDWVKLIGKKSHQTIMEENFDGPGSNVIWHQ
ncbi:hypothetical protein BH10BAC2_BH10BAC2_07730 [soil metagenome]